MAASAAAVAINPAVAAAAAAIAAQGNLAAAEDDYDADPAAAAARPAVLPVSSAAQLLQQQQQQISPSMASLLQVHQLQQLQQQQLAGLQGAGLVASTYLRQVQQQVQQQQQQQQQLHPGASIPQPAAAPAAAAAAAPPVRPARPELTAEQLRKIMLTRATPMQDAKQQALSFVYLDLDEGGEDIVHFSELFAPSDSAVRVSLRGDRTMHGRGDSGGKYRWKRLDSMTRYWQQGYIHRTFDQHRLFIT
jgi:hypothetical protein